MGKSFEYPLLPDTEADVVAYAMQALKINPLKYFSLLRLFFWCFRSEETASEESKSPPSSSSSSSCCKKICRTTKRNYAFLGTTALASICCVAGISLIVMGQYSGARFFLSLILPLLVIACIHTATNLRDKVFLPLSTMQKDKDQDNTNDTNNIHDTKKKEKENAADALEWIKWIDLGSTFAAVVAMTGVSAILALDLISRSNDGIVVIASQVLLFFIWNTLIAIAVSLCSLFTVVIVVILPWQVTTIAEVMKRAEHENILEAVKGTVLPFDLVERAQTSPLSPSARLAVSDHDDDDDDDDEEREEYQQRGGRQLSLAVPGGGMISSSSLSSADMQHHHQQQQRPLTYFPKRNDMDNAIKLFGALNTSVNEALDIWIYPVSIILGAAVALSVFALVEWIFIQGSDFLTQDTIPMLLAAPVFLLALGLPVGRFNDTSNYQFSNTCLSWASYSARERRFLNKFFAAHTLGMSICGFRFKTAYITGILFTQGLGWVIGAAKSLAKVNF